MNNMTLTEAGAIIDEVLASLEESKREEFQLAMRVFFTNFYGPNIKIIEDMIIESRENSAYHYGRGDDTLAEWWKRHATRLSKSIGK